MTALLLTRIVRKGSASAARNRLNVVSLMGRQCSFFALDERIVASCDPHTRAAFWAMASSTGWVSVGELAITPRISLVAVCCSQRLLDSWNSRTFSIAITAWSAKVSTSSISLSVNGSTNSRRIVMAPIGMVLTAAAVPARKSSNAGLAYEGSHWYRVQLAHAGRESVCASTNARPLGTSRVRR